MSDRCTGHCCDAFFVDWLNVAAYAAMGDPDAIQTKAMIRRLLPGSFFAPTGLPIPENETRIFTCTNLGPDHNCTVYETRPAMCSRYPYGGRCLYPGCTWDEARAPQGPEPIEEKGDPNV